MKIVKEKIKNFSETYTIVKSAGGEKNRDDVYDLIEDDVLETVFWKVLRVLKKDCDENS